MVYTLEEMKAKLEAILQSENPGITSEVLVDVQNNYTAILSELAALAAKAEKLESDNQSLIIANGNLFQAVGLTKEKDKETTEEEEDALPVEDVLLEMLENAK